jgi:MFS family permease
VIGAADTARPALVRLAGTLLATSMLGRLPQAMSALALVRVVIDGGGGYAYSGALTAAYVIASTIGTPVLGRIIDGTGRSRAVLPVSAAVSSAALLALAPVVATAPGPALALGVVAGFAFPPIEPTLRSLWPRIAAPGRSSRGCSAPTRRRRRWSSSSARCWRSSRPRRSARRAVCS